MRLARSRAWPVSNPSGHAVHATLSMALVRYLPGVHCTQPAPACPAGHFWHVALPTSDWVPVAQGTHDVALAFSANAFPAHGPQPHWPCWSLKRPGTHGKHPACSGLFW